MAANDPTSLDSLVDIVVPPPVGWWPLAPGWIVLAGFVSLMLAVRLWKWASIWKQNAYRRLALRELDRIVASEGRQMWSALPALLKRTALAAWPRSEVASLTGADWLGFLNRTTRSPTFRSHVGQQLIALSYESDAVRRFSPAAFHELVEASRSWIRDHERPEAAS